MRPSVRDVVRSSELQQRSRRHIDRRSHFKFLHPASLLVLRILNPTHRFSLFSRSQIEPNKMEDNHMFFQVHASSRKTFHKFSQRNSSRIAMPIVAALFLLPALACRNLGAQGTVTLNFASPVNSTGSPLMFGASNEPNPADQATVYPMFWNSGLRFERGTIHIDQVVPSGTTLTAYLAALPDGVGSYTAGSVADPSTWNWGPLSWATYAKAQGMTTMANLLNVPQWLSYDDTSVNTAPVNNWNSLGIAWEDIVTKVVKHELTACNGGACLNYLEIENEPTCNNWMKIGSGDTSWTGGQAQVVELYYYYAAVAAHAADSALVIGGPAECESGPTDWGYIPDLLTFSYFSKGGGGLLSFVSYHDYTPDEAYDNVSDLSSIMSTDGYGGDPIFMTEWNYTWVNGTTDPHVVGDEATTYIGDTLIFFSQQAQMKGGGIYTMLPNNVAASSYEDCPGCIITQGLYSVNGSTYTLANQMRTYRLMSVDLGLGSGTFKAFPATLSGLSGNDYALGYTNSVHNVAAVIVNDATATTATVNLENIDTSGCNFTVYIYYADTGSNTAASPAETLTNQCITGGTMTLSNLTLPNESVVGIIIN